VTRLPVPGSVTPVSAVPVRAVVIPAGQDTGALGVGAQVTGVPVRAAPVRRMQAAGAPVRTARVAVAVPQAAAVGTAVPQASVVEVGPVEVGPVEVGQVDIGLVEVGWVDIGPVEAGPVGAKLVGAVAGPPRPSDEARHRRPAPPRPAVLTVPVSLRGVRARPRRLAVLGVLVLLVAVAVVLGIRVAWAHSSAKPASIAAAAHGPPGGLMSRSVPAAFAAGGATVSPTAAGALLVHVVGQVSRPGVVRLPAGSRVLDAVAAAGGALRSADLNHLNLARVVVDGEQIVVPKPGEVIPAAGASGVPGAGAGPAGQGSTGGGLVGALVDLNAADAAALDSLPGVGPVLSQRILDWRAQHGRFSSVDELGEVSGIGDKLLAQIRPKVKV
jgi:competence protein ComEA